MNPLSLFRKFGEAFQGQWQDYNNSRRMGPDWREQMRYDSEMRDFNRGLKVAEFGRIQNAERKLAADSARIELENQDRIFKNKEALAKFESRTSPDDDVLTDSRNISQKHIAEYAASMRQERDFAQAGEVASRKNAEDNVVLSKLGKAIQLSEMGWHDPLKEMAQEFGHDPDALKGLIRRSEWQGAEDILDVKSKELENLLDAGRHKRQQMINDYANTLDPEEAAKFLSGFRESGEETMFTSGHWDRMYDTTVQRLAEERGHVRDMGEGILIPMPTEKDERDAMRMVKEQYQELEGTGAFSMPNPEGVDWGRSPEAVLQNPTGDSPPLDRTNPENVLSIGRSSGSSPSSRRPGAGFEMPQPTRQRTLADAGGMDREARVSTSTSFGQPGVTPEQRGQRSPEMEDWITQMFQKYGDLENWPENDYNAAAEYFSSIP